MKMRKIISIILAIILALGVLAGCSKDDDKSATNQKTKKTEKEETKETVELDDFQIADEEIEISWLGYATLAGCREGTATEELLEDEFNVELDPIFLESGNYQDKKSAILASGEIPDLIYELDPAHVYKDVEDQFLYEVPYEVIKTFAPSLYDSINDKAKTVWSYSYYDGKNWGVPNINHAHMATRTAGYRQDWLDDVGMEVPTTVDELHDVLKAFMDADLGRGDTYGYTPYGSHYQFYFSEIFGAYGVLPFDWQEVNGEIVYGGLRPEVETVLSILQDWYSEGIIYPAFAEDNIDLEKSATKLFTTDQIGYVSYLPYEDIGSKTSYDKSLKKLIPNAKVTYASQVKGPNGDYGMRGWGYPCHVVSFGWTDIEDNEKDAVKVATILNMFEKIYTDDDLLMEIRYGKEGEQYGVDYSSTAASAFAPMNEYKDAANRRLEGYEFGASGPTFWTPFAPSDDFYEASFTNDYKDFMDTYQNENAVLVDALYKVDIVPSAAWCIEVLRTEQIKLMNQIIMGQSNVAPDEFCEEFEKIWQRNGGEQLLEEAKEQQKINEEILKQLP